MGDLRHPISSSPRRSLGKDNVLASSSSSSIVEYDFSSPYFWEDFYQKQLRSVPVRTGEEDNPITAEEDQSKNAFIFEWHDSIPLQDLAALLPAQSKCLLVGCGNSYLPQVILDRNDKIHLTLLDTSQTCLKQLEAQYDAKDVSCVCGSATEMTSYFVAEPPCFDCIIDKGLTDAFMCGEGWETQVQALFRESSQLFHPKQGGTYILISYKLHQPIQELLQEMCDSIVGELAWEWQFDTEPLSNHRVSLSVARVRPKMMSH